MADSQKNMQIVQKILAGDIFGEIGVLCNRPQPFTVRTTELSQILRINRTSLTNTIHAHKADGHIIMSNLYLKLTSLGSQGFLEHQKVEEYLCGGWFSGPQKCKMCSTNGCEAQLHESSLMNGGWKATNEVETQEYHDSTTCGLEIHSAVQDNQLKFCSAVQDKDLGAVKILLDEGSDMSWGPADPSMQQGNRNTYDQLRCYRNRELYDRIRLEVDEKQTRGLESHKLCHNSNQAVAEKSRSSNFIEQSAAATSKYNNKIRVIIHMQSQSDCMEKQFGKLIVLPDSIEELLSIAGQKFGGRFTKIINTENAQVEDIGAIRDGDHLLFLQ